MQKKSILGLITIGFCIGLNAKAANREPAQTVQNCAPDVEKAVLSADSKFFNNQGCTVSYMITMYDTGAGSSGEATVHCKVGTTEEQRLYGIQIAHGSCTTTAHPWHAPPSALR